MTSHEILASTVTVFGAALGAAWLFRILRAPAVIGFLFAGFLIGPSGLRLITREVVGDFSELGLVLLLFTVGLELSPELLLRGGRRLIKAAGYQIVGTAVVIGGVLAVTGTAPLQAGVIFCIAATLSSTAIVLKVISDRGETDTPAGALIAGILLAQDIFVIAVMLLLPLAGAAATVAGGSVALRGLVAVGGLAAATMLARRTLPTVVDQVVRRGGRELMTLLAIVMACLGAWLAELAGWSPALGSCIAGLLLSETDVRHQLHAEITPFRDAFSALFFVSLGMMVRHEVVFAHAGMLALAVLATLPGKALLTALAVRVAGWPTRLAVHAGLALCTVSEFGYVLGAEADKHRLLPAGALDVLVAYAVGTMLIGALFLPAAGPFSLACARWLDRRGREQTDGTESADAAGPESGGHVIIVGYGVNGENLSRVLKATGIRHHVIEQNRDLARRAREDGAEVLIGDATRSHILHGAGLMSARALVVAINDSLATRQIVAQTRAARPNLYILARTRYVDEIEPLRRLGAHEVIPEEFETSVEIFAHVLKEFAVPDNVVAAQVAMVRAGQYSMLRGGPGTAPPRSDLMRLLELTVTQTFLVEAGSRGAGRTIRELDLRRGSGASIIAIVREGRPTTNPDGDMRLEPNDVLVLVGAHKQLDAARALLGA